MLMKYNIVFLDFDGVLNGSDWFSEITVKDEQTGIYKRNTESSISEYFSKEWIEKNDDYKIKITSFGRNISKYNMNNLINALSQIDDVAVVLSTSWRNVLSLESWRVLFSKIPNWNFTIFGVTLENTPEELISGVSIFDIMNNTSNTRGKEIQSWLTEFKDYYKNYIILDDDSDMLPEQMNNFLRTNYKTGLTEEDVNKVISHFKNKGE